MVVVVVVNDGSFLYSAGICHRRALVLKYPVWSKKGIGTVLKYELTLLWLQTDGPNLTVNALRLTKMRLTPIILLGSYDVTVESSYVWNVDILGYRNSSDTLQKAFTFQIFSP